jgi:hypothetical protein
MPQRTPTWGVLATDLTLPEVPGVVETRAAGRRLEGAGVVEAAASAIVRAAVVVVLCWEERGGALVQDVCVCGSDGVE